MEPGIRDGPQGCYPKCRSGAGYTREVDAPTTACPNCGTPRGPYDRFCTGCAADLGAPGAPIGNIGTLGSMSVAGPSSRQARASAAPVSRTMAGWVVPGVRSRPYSAAPTGPLRQVGTPSAARAASSSPGADRLWRTLGIANRAIAVAWLVIVLAALASTLRRPDPTTLVATVIVLALFALPSLVLWNSAPGLMRGDPVWLRSIVLIEMMVVVIATLGLALVPLLLIFVVAGDEP
jgi:hypothetical protein